MALKSKRDDLFKRWTDENYDIILLQDTHWNTESLVSVKREWDKKNDKQYLNVQFKRNLHINK